MPAVLPLEALRALRAELTQIRKDRPDLVNPEPDPHAVEDWIEELEELEEEEAEVDR